MDIVAINATGNESAKSILKAELVRKGISYQQLAEMMAARGWKLTKASLDNKMCRGTFNADFLLDALRVIGCQGLGIYQSESGKK